MEPSDNSSPAPNPVPPPLTPATPPPLTAAPPPQFYPPAVTQPPRRSRWWVWLLILVMLGGLGLWFAGKIHLIGMHTGTARLDGKSYEEHFLTDKDTDNKIITIDIGGVISSHDFDGGGDMVERVKEEFELAEKDANVKAVILKVDSPGGEVLASDEIYRAVEEFQSRTKRPVVAQMGSLAASGGYYVSAPCRWIVANELTLTGSIGVIMSGMNFRGLMDKVGVQPQVYKSGKFKDMMSSTRRPEDIPEGEREMMQSLIDETYATFKGVVKKGRAASHTANKDGRELAKDWESYADGRIFSGKEALRLGFVDELGNFDVAVKRAKKLAGITEANLVKYQPPFAFGNFLRFLGKSDAHAVKVDLGFDFPRLQAGRMYFLSFNVVQ